MINVMADELYKPTLEGTPIRQFTIAEYHRMAELGFFAGERVELLFGRSCRRSTATPTTWQSSRVSART